MQKTLQKLTIIALLAGLSLAVSACLKKPAVNTNQPVNQNTNTAAEEIDTSDWQTYRNEEYGFEFKYPRDWQLEEKYSKENGYFISKGESRLVILPKGEFDSGLPFEEPLIKNLFIDDKEVVTRQWNLEGQKILIIYNFITEIPNWIKCDDNFKNCNRLELFAENKENLETLISIISKFKFFR